MTAPRGREGGGGGVPQSARGAVIVGLAVLLGIVGLQILDDSDTSTVVGGGGSVTATTAGTSTTLPAPRAPKDVHVKVYNASGVQGQAQATTDKLMSLGYTTLEPGDYGSTRVGTVVQCRPGFEVDAEYLAGFPLGNAAVEDYPSTLPTGASDADCLVIEGKAA